MSLKIEAVITVWEDGLFRMRDKTEADNMNSLKEKLEVVMNNIVEKLAELDRKKHAIGEDDDIPF